MQLTGKQSNPAAWKGYCSPPTEPCTSGKDNESCAFKIRRNLVRKVDLGSRGAGPRSCGDNEGLCTIFAGMPEPPSVMFQSTASFFAGGTPSLLKGKSQEEITALPESAPQGKVHFWSDS